MLGTGVAGAGLIVDLGEPGFGQGQAVLVALGLVLALASWLPVEYNTRILLVVGAVGFSSLLAEVALRLVLSPQRSTAYQLDEQLLHKYIAGEARDFRHLPANGGQTIRVEINSRGYRGAELREPKAHPRVVVYGDSTIAAEFSELEHTFARQLDVRLDSALGTDVEVVNAGVIAYGPDQVLARMQGELSELEPDLVVLGIFSGNDLGDLLRNKLFKLDGEGHLAANAFVLGESLRARFSQAASGPMVYKVLLKSWRLLKRRLRAGPKRQVDLTVARTRQWLSRCQGEYREYVIEGDNVVKNLLSDSYDADVSLMPGSESAVYKIRLMEQVLTKIQRVADDHGVPLVFMIIPSPLDACTHYDWAHIDREAFPEYRPTTLTDTFAGLLEAGGQRFVNLFELFQEEDLRRELYLGGGDVHWNDAGQELAAELMGRYIVEEGLLFTVPAARPGSAATFEPRAPSSPGRGPR